MLAFVFLVRKLFSILVSSLACRLMQDPNFSLRDTILLAASAVGRYRYVSIW